MEVALGKVVDGKVVIDGAPLEEGATVAVLIKGEENFTATPEQEAELLESMEQARHGEVVDAVMPSMRSDRARLSPNYLLAHHSMAWACAQGARFYNWQGSPPHSGVHRFKTQWGSRDAAYCFLTRVTGDATPFLESTVDEIARGFRLAADRKAGAIKVTVLF